MRILRQHGTAHALLCDACVPIPVQRGGCGGGGVGGGNALALYNCAHRPSTHTITQQGKSRSRHTPAADFPTLPCDDDDGVGCQLLTARVALDTWAVRSCNCCGEHVNCTTRVTFSASDVTR